MQDLERALADIGTIRSQLARDVGFRGFGPATVAATGVIAIAAAIGQAIWLPAPRDAFRPYLALWIGVAIVSMALIAVETVTRSRRLHSNLADEMIAAAIEQLLPALAAGGLLTAVLVRFVPEGLTLLPGLWQLVFALGIFASSRSLPRTTFWAGIWYLLCGLASLALARDSAAFSPWAMGVPFGLGQILAAALLHRALGGDRGEG
jgi:hypothetical protein